MSTEHWPTFRLPVGLKHWAVRPPSLRSWWNKWSQNLWIYLWRKPSHSLNTGCIWWIGGQRKSECAGSKCCKASHPKTNLPHDISFITTSISLSRNTSWKASTWVYSLDDKRFLLACHYFQPKFSIPPSSPSILFTHSRPSSGSTEQQHIHTSHVEKPSFPRRNYFWRRVAVQHL